MRILDRYIASRFLNTQLFALIAFVSIFVVIDGVENLSHYIDKGASSGVIVRYYLYYIPFITALIMPITMLLASMFSIGQLAKYNELLAMKTSGISLQRILAPVYVVGILASILMLLFGEVIVPRANSKKEEIKRMYIDRRGRNVPAQIANLYFQDEIGRRIFIGYYNTHSKSARKITILELSGSRVTDRIDAEMMQWQKDHWVLIKAYKRELSQNDVSFQYFDSLSVGDISLGPDELGEVQKQPEEMSYQELEKFIYEVKKNGGDPDRWLVDLYLKISFPIANFIIVLFGAPLASTRVRSTGALGIAISLVICFLYFGTIKTGQTLGQLGTLPPLIGAWLGNIIFFLAGIWVNIRSQK